MAWPAGENQAWRISKLDDVAFYAGPKPNWWPWWRATAVCWNCPDPALLRCHRAAWPRAKSRRQPAPDTVNLTATDTAAASRWLAALRDNKVQAAWI